MEKIKVVHSIEIMNSRFAAVEVYNLLVGKAYDWHIEFLMSVLMLELA